MDFPVEGCLNATSKDVTSCPSGPALRGAFLPNQLIGPAGAASTAEDLEFESGYDELRDDNSEQFCAYVGTGSSQQGDGEVLAALVLRIVYQDEAALVPQRDDLEPLAVAHVFRRGVPRQRQ